MPQPHVMLPQWNCAFIGNMRGCNTSKSIFFPYIGTYMEINPCFYVDTYVAIKSHACVSKVYIQSKWAALVGSKCVRKC